MKKLSIAIVRGKFLNKYEMQFYEPLVKQFDMTAFGSFTSYHNQFAFPVVKLLSPMDVSNFPYKMPILNRLFVDAHYLLGLENRLKGFDIVHTAETYFHYTQQCLNAKRKGYIKKVIATVLENIPFNNEGIWGRKDFKKRARLELDHIIALTNLTKQTLIQEGVDAKKITVIGHFIDTKRFSPTSEQQMRIGSKHKEICILYCGRLEEEKGVFDLVDAVEFLLRDPELKNFRITVTMIGNGSKYNEILSKEKRLGVEKYFFHKSVEYNDMPKEYRRADIYVAPSKETPTWKEQYNTTLLEAQASGLPIVTTRSGGIPENIGDAGVVITPGDVKILYDAIKKLILDVKLRKRYAHLARRRAINTHDISIGAERLKKLYLSL